MMSANASNRRSAWRSNGWRLRLPFSSISNCLSGTILLMCQHFLPRGQYTPECRKGLGQDVSRADEIGIALVIAGDTAKHLSLAVAPIVLTTSGRVEERRPLGHAAAGILGSRRSSLSPFAIVLFHRRLQ